MRCEVCGHDHVTSKLHTPKGVFYLCWACEKLAAVLIGHARRDRWELESHGTVEAVNQ